MHNNISPMADAGMVDAAMHSRSKRRRWYPWILSLLLLGLSTTLLVHPYNNSSNPAVITSPTTSLTKHPNTSILTILANSSTEVFHRNDNSSSTSLPLFSSPTILAILHGQFGNQVSTIAEAIAISLYARERYGTHANVSIRFFKNYRDPMNHVNTCFPSTRILGNNDSDHIGPWEKAQVSYWNRTDYAKQLLIDRKGSQEQVNQVLTYWQEQLQTNPSTTFVPYVGVLRFLTFDMLDRYYDQLREFFQWNDQACCKIKPDADESVFHFRNFAGEGMGIQRAKLGGFEELGPNQTALALFGHLQAGDKVAISTFIPAKRRNQRFWTVEHYVTALEAHGLIVRVVSGQSAMEDFCFLLYAQKELVGSRVSTFAKWAAYLGNVTRAQLYFVESNKNLPYGDDFEPYNWTQPVLKARMVMLQLDPGEE